MKLRPFGGCSRNGHKWLLMPRLPCQHIWHLWIAQITHFFPMKKNDLKCFKAVLICWWWWWIPLWWAYLISQKTVLINVSIFKLDGYSIAGWSIFHAGNISEFPMKNRPSIAGFRSHGGTPSHHPFFFGIFPELKTIHPAIKGYPHSLEIPTWACYTTASCPSLSSMNPPFVTRRRLRPKTKLR